MIILLLLQNNFSTLKGPITVYLQQKSFAEMF